MDTARLVTAMKGRFPKEDFFSFFILMLLSEDPLEQKHRLLDLCKEILQKDDPATALEQVESDYRALGPTHLQEFQIRYDLCRFWLSRNLGIIFDDQTN